MFNWLRRRRISPEARKRLLLASARSEEALVETHVSNLLDLLDALDGEVSLDRTIELYAEMVSLEESKAAAVVNRLLARLESPQPPRGSRRSRFDNVFSDEPRR